MIDYTKPRWGHNFTFKQDEDGLMRGFVWHRLAVREGDRMKWKTSYGVAIGEVVEVRWMGDPEDMYEVTLKVVDREVNKEWATSHTTQ